MLVKMVWCKEVMKILKGGIYRSPLEFVIIIMLTSAVGWAYIGYICSKQNKQKNIWKVINIFLTVGEIMIVLESTIMYRTIEKKELILIPFYSFYEAIEQPEFYRSMLMNVLLFEPLGLSLPFALPDKLHKKVKFSIEFGFLLSVFVEVIQYVFLLGRTEVDDVICNTFGCAIGAGAYLIYQKRNVLRKYLGEVYLIMRNAIKQLVKKLSNTKLVILLSLLWQFLTWIECFFFQGMWLLTDKKKPTLEEVKLVCENVTFFYKSFERQKMAKRLYKSIQSYYPGVKVVIADDSSKPLELTGENLEIIQLPFNSGLSRGLNKALEKVDTPFVVRMDDDQLLTPYTKIHEHIRFLQKHTEVDLVGILLYHLPRCRSLQKAAEEYYKQPMNYAPKKLIIPHLTEIDDTHIVVGKSSNTFVARTDKLKEIGYDDNIRMIDHNEFFYRAAGNIVSVLDKSAYVLHYRNRFDMHYNKYRSDYEGDRIYIQNKMRKNIIKSD